MLITSFRGKHEFLSNFYPCPITAFGETWPTAEHLFQGMKAARPEDRQRIRAATTPGAAKRLGRQVQRIAYWEQQRKRVMLRVALAKFEQHPELAARLAATGNATLVEGNTWEDIYWGAVAAFAGDSELPRWGASGLVGENWLGRILEMARDVIDSDPGPGVA